MIWINKMSWMKLIRIYKNKKDQPKTKIFKCHQTTV